MPNYAYRCQACGAQVEQQRPMAARNDPLPCPSCGAGMSRDWGHYPYTELLWHTDQGIGDRLAIPAARSRGNHGHSSNAARTGG